ncbi:TPA: hypothetical protein SOL37_004124, partial [Clostridioides difficile]|nr:hypothetical protein [Clostridioides difficile]HBF4189910.1 hypothetical protein [Clostridioides difficile]HBF4895095.1 hypothetical protein [Clostridioides difficile]HBF7138231.1 hypothetical protein [Clostridioides difficile]HBF9649303.1 hypothetical protein [Clostridioides difficile]
GLLLDERKINYSCGSIENLKKKAELLAKDDRILLVTIDKVEEVIKDTRSQKMAEYYCDGGIEI